MQRATVVTTATQVLLATQIILLKEIIPTIITIRIVKIIPTIRTSPIITGPTRIMIDAITKLQTIHPIRRPVIQTVIQLAAIQLQAIIPVRIITVIQTVVPTISQITIPAVVVLAAA